MSARICNNHRFQVIQPFLCHQPFFILWLLSFLCETRKSFKLLLRISSCSSCSRIEAANRKIYRYCFSLRRFAPWNREPGPLFFCQGHLNLLRDILRTPYKAHSRRETSLNTCHWVEPRGRRAPERWLNQKAARWFLIRTMIR